MNDQLNRLFEAADQVKGNAYAPYSGYRVGAALLTKNGDIVTGCNVENAVYGLTICAEQSAISAAIAKGYGPGDFKAIAIAASAPDFSPCGACRQALHEFGSDMDVVFEFGGEKIVSPLAELLPKGFER